MKWNFDGSTIGTPRPSGYGGILQDDEGKVCWVIYGPLGDVNSTKAELLSLLYGLRELKALGKHGCLVEGDSKVMVGWDLGLSEGSWALLHYIYEVREIIREIGVVLSHIPRCQNGEVDKLAKWGQKQVVCYKGISLLD